MSVDHPKGSRTRIRGARRERAIKIGDQVVGMFEPDGETEQRLGRSRLRAFNRLPMFDQTFNAAEAGRAGENSRVDSAAPSLPRGRR